MAEILILTGPPGSGKTSVAQALADRYDRVAHVNVDTLRHFITPTGFRAPGKDGFERQHALAVRNACDLARNYMAERFAVIIDDVLRTVSRPDAAPNVQVCVDVDADAFVAMWIERVKALAGA